MERAKEIRKCYGRGGGDDERKKKGGSGGRKKRKKKVVLIPFNLITNTAEIKNTVKNRNHHNLTSSSIRFEPL